MMANLRHRPQIGTPKEKGQLFGMSMDSGSTARAQSVLDLTTTCAFALSFTIPQVKLTIGGGCSQVDIQSRANPLRHGRDGHPDGRPKLH